VANRGHGTSTSKRLWCSTGKNGTQALTCETTATGSAGLEGARRAPTRGDSSSPARRPARRGRDRYRGGGHAAGRIAASRHPRRGGARRSAAGRNQAPLLRATGRVRTGGRVRRNILGAAARRAESRNRAQTMTATESFRTTIDIDASPEHVFDYFVRP